MQMIYRLSAIIARIDDDAVAFGQPLFPGEIRRNPQQMPQQRGMLLACLGQRNKMLARRNQQVHWRLGMNIREGITPVVLVLRRRRNASINDLAKKAAHNRNSLQESVSALRSSWQEHQNDRSPTRIQTQKALTQPHT